MQNADGWTHYGGVGTKGCSLKSPVLCYQAASAVPNVAGYRATAEKGRSTFGHLGAENGSVESPQKSTIVIMTFPGKWTYDQGMSAPLFVQSCLESTRRGSLTRGAILWVVAIASGLVASADARAQSTQWDSLFSNTQWYVPTQNMLAYSASSTDLSDAIPVADQTIWSLGEVVNGQFTGTSNAEFKIGSTTFTSSNSMNGVVTDSGQVRILFSNSGSPTTIGIGQLRTVEGTTYFEMQMISGGSSYITHWAYMAPYSAGTTVLPPLDVAPSQLRSPEWNWMQGTSWLMQNNELFGEGGSGNFSVTNYQNGYFWGTGTGPVGSEAESFSFIGSATPEGNILFNLLSGSTLTSLTGLIAGDASDGSMVLRSYSAIGTLGDPSEAMVVPEPSAMMMLLATAVGFLLVRRFSRPVGEIAAR